MDFSQALKLLKEGYKMARNGWNGKGMYVQAQFPDENSKMKKPYLYITPDATDVVPWQPSPWDLFTDDWYIVGEEQA